MPNSNGNGEKEIADESSFLVPRDSEGNRLFVPKELRSGETVMIKPLAEGDIQQYFGDIGMVTELSDEEIAELLDEFIGEPLAEHDIDVDFLHDYFKPSKAIDLIYGLLEKSGAIVDDIELDEDMENMEVSTKAKGEEDEEKKA